MSNAMDALRAEVEKARIATNLWYKALREACDHQMPEATLNHCRTEYRAAVEHEHTLTARLRRFERLEA